MRSIHFHMSDTTHIILAFKKNDRDHLLNVGNTHTEYSWDVVARFWVFDLLTSHDLESPSKSIGIIYSILRTHMPRREGSSFYLKGGSMSIHLENSAQNCYKSPKSSKKGGGVRTPGSVYATYDTKPTRNLRLKPRNQKRRAWRQFNLWEKKSDFSNTKINDIRYILTIVLVGLLLCPSLVRILLLVNTWWLFCCFWRLRHWNNC